MIPIEKNQRLCFFCKNFEFQPFSPGYSHRTPGEAMNMLCKLGLWNAAAAYTAEELTAQVLMARGCDHYGEEV